MFLALLYRIIKPTFQAIIPDTCVHLKGPSQGVKQATQSITRALGSGQFNYFMRLDIKGHDASIHRRAKRTQEAADLGARLKTIPRSLWQSARWWQRVAQVPVRDYFLLWSWLTEHQCSELLPVIALNAYMKSCDHLGLTTCAFSLATCAPGLDAHQLFVHQIERALVLVV